MDHPSPGRFRALLAPAVAAVLAVALAGCVGGHARVASGPSASPMSIGTPTPTPSLAASSTPTPTASATSATCSSDDLAASVGRSGAAAGTQITEIDFANTSNHPCDLSGVPALIGIRADGTQVALAFRGTSDPAYGIQPVTDGGVIQPGGTALIKATMQLNQCAVPVSTLAGFAQLGIRFPGGPSVTMPYPAALRSTGCPGNVSRVGLGS